MDFVYSVLVWPEHMSSNTMVPLLCPWSCLKGQFVQLNTFLASSPLWRKVPLGIKMLTVPTYTKSHKCNLWVHLQISQCSGKVNGIFTAGHCGIKEPNTHTATPGPLCTVVWNRLTHWSYIVVRVWEHPLRTVTQQNPPHHKITTSFPNLGTYYVWSEGTCWSSSWINISHFTMCIWSASKARWVTIIPILVEENWGTKPPNASVLKFSKCMCTLFSIISFPFSAIQDHKTVMHWVIVIPAKTVGVNRGICLRSRLNCGMGWPIQFLPTTIGPLPNVYASRLPVPQFWGLLSMTLSNPKCNTETRWLSCGG